MANVGLTTPAVNAALKQAGAKEYLVKGKGIFFFAGGKSSKWTSCKVEVDDLNKLTLEQWVDKWKELSSGKPVEAPVAAAEPHPVEVQQPTTKRRTTLRVGALVRLKPDVAKQVKCPEGRENNRQARILTLLSRIEGGVYTDRDLRGYRAWSVDDLEVLAE